MSEDHDLLIEINQKVSTVHQWVQDQEKRIRDLEAATNKGKGIWLGMATAAGVVGGFISKLVK